MYVSGSSRARATEERGSAGKASGDARVEAESSDKEGQRLAAPCDSIWSRFMHTVTDHEHGLGPRTRALANFVDRKICVFVNPNAKDLSVECGFKSSLTQYFICICMYDIKRNALCDSFVYILCAISCIALSDVYIFFDGIAIR